jgi:hypothetical protein
METIAKTRNKKDVGVLTARQIRNRVGDGWAIVQDPEYNGCIFLGGKLLYHNADRLQTYKEFGKCKNGTFLIMFCGKQDPNVIYLL